MTLRTQTVCSVLAVSLHHWRKEMEGTRNRWKSKRVNFSSSCRRIVDLWAEITFPHLRSELCGRAFSLFTVCFTQNSNLVLYRHSGEGGWSVQGAIHNNKHYREVEIKLWGWEMRFCRENEWHDEQWRCEVQWRHKMRMRCKTQFEQCCE